MGIFPTDVDKLYEISDNLVLGVNGDPGDMIQFTQFISNNLKLYSVKNKYQLGASAVAHFTRKNMVDGLRGENPYILNLMLASYSPETGGQLYTMDFLASCVKVPFAAHGLGGLLAFSIMDRYYRPDLAVPEAYEVLKMCIRAVQMRLFVNLPQFRVKTVSQYGVLTLPDINSAMLLLK